MHIRIKTNPSGSKSVILLQSERRPGKKSSYTRVIKTFGSSKIESEIEMMKKEAEKYMNQLNDENNITGKDFKFKNSKDISSCKSTNTSYHDIYGRYYDKIFKNCELLTISKSKLLKDLSILRIANPASKKRTAEISSYYGCEFKVDSAYKLMDKIDDNVISSIKSNISDYSKKLLKQENRDIEVVFYDLTTIYFEANDKDDLRQFGFSKDGKSQHVQITLALLVTSEGLPIGYELFPGNMYEGHTLSVILDKLSLSYNINNVVVVADSGLISKDNMSILRSKGYKYIIAARIKNMTNKLKSNLLCNKDYKTVNDDISSKVIKYDDHSSLVCCYSIKKAKKDSYERQEKLGKLMKKNGKSLKELLPSKNNKPYVKIDSKAKIVVDEDVANDQAKYDGYYVLITNIKKTKQIDPMQVISQYKGLWQIERSFRIMKTDLSIRPVYHWTVNRMKAHFAICYISFALVRYLQFTLKNKNIILSARNIKDALDTVNVTIIEDKEGNLFRFLQDMSNQAQDLYKATRVAMPKKFQARQA